MPNVLTPTTQDNTLLDKIANRQPLSDADFAAMDSFERKVYAAMNRTPEQIEADQQETRQRLIPGRPLPPGKTLEDLFVEISQIPDDEEISEEEFLRRVADI